MSYELEKLHIYDPNTLGTKGLIFLGDKLLVYRRDSNTNVFPLYVDVPGGGPEQKETPFETFKREAKEEFDLDIKKKDIVYARKYESSKRPGMYDYFCVAKLSLDKTSSIKLGDEGLGYYLMKVDEYLNATDAWPIFQERTRDYLATTG